MELVRAVDADRDTYTNTETEETTNRALARISVRQPYFDLRNLRETGDGIVTADIPPAPTSEPEVGAVEAAQVARHLAILGSCAATLGRDDDARHHYLATRAHYARLSNAPTVTDGPLRAEALASWSNRRTARALVKLCTESGHGLNLLDVEYAVMNPKMFDRLHPPIDTDTDTSIGTDTGTSIGTVSETVGGGSSTGDPTVAAAELPFDVTYLSDGVRIDCGKIPVALCAGHFPDYPAAPVAILMGQLGRAAGLKLAQHVGSERVGYRVEEGRVSAQKLATAGQHLVLHAAYDRTVPGGHQLTGRAEAGGEVAGELTITMSAHTPNLECG